MNAEPYNLKNKTLVLGGSGLAGMFNPVSEHDAENILATAIGRGVYHVDTAPFYGHGLSEVRIGNFLRQNSELVPQVKLSTKVGRLLVPCEQGQVERGIWAEPLSFNVVFDYSYDGIMRSFESSAERLGVETVDTLYIHDLDKRTHGEGLAGRVRELRDSGWNALLELKSEGRVRNLGIGLNEIGPAISLQKEFGFDEIMLAGRLTLLDYKEALPLLRICQDDQTSIVAVGVFNSGILINPSREGVRFDYAPASTEVQDLAIALQEKCETFGIDLPSAAMAFPRLFSSVRAVAVGVRSSQQLEQNLAWNDQSIPKEFWDDILGPELSEVAGPGVARIGDRVD